MSVIKPYKVELYEVLPKDFYEAFSHRGNLLWHMFDQRAVITLSRLRRKYGTVILNTWYWGGKHQYRGWRPMSSSVGAALSQHKFGRAFDCVFKHVSAEQVRKDLKENPWAPEFNHIARVEKNVDWFHFDCGPIFNPNMVVETEEMIYFPRLNLEC